MGLFRKKKGKVKLDIVKDFLSSERYILDGTIGQGGMGKVECQFDKGLHRLVAVKSLLSTHQDNPIQLQSLLNEVRLSSFLQHPGIVPIHNAWADQDGNLFYSMQMIEGEDLATLFNEAFRRERFLPLSQVLSIFTKICETMSYAHDKGVLHLDLKPDNIMLGGFGEVFIVDWGSAKLFDSTEYESSLRRYGLEEKMQQLLVQEDAISGTPPYMPREQFTVPPNQLKPSTDIFALGVILYLLLSHQSPYSFDQGVGAYYQGLENDIPTPLHELRGDLPLSLSEVCARMLLKDPEARYQHTHDIIKDIDGISDAGSSFVKREFAQGELIFRQGEVGDCAFLILSGYIEIFAETGNERKFLATRGEGEIIGELAVFTKMPRNVSAKALVPTTIKVMKEDDIIQEFDKLSPWVGQMITGLSKKFRNLNAQYVKKVN